MLSCREDYHKLVKALDEEPEEEVDRICRELAKEDLFFLCWFVLGWDFYDCDFAFDFCREIEKDPSRLWLVARGHLKSLTITTAHNIQLMLNDPDITIAVISYNLKTAKAFLRQIKQELEDNLTLKHLFKDILYDRPDKQSSKWSEQEGLMVRRTAIRKEPTFYAFGLVDSQATGMHFDVHSFDDVVTQDSVTSDEMIQKTTERWQLSDNLGMMTAKGTMKKYAGTRYHWNDTYQTMIDAGIPTTVIPATEEGTMEGKPIFLTQEIWDKKKKEQGTYICSCQNLLKPMSDKEKPFKREQIKFWDTLPRINKYVMFDPANAKTKGADFTAGLVVGYGSDNNIYLIDGIHDKIDVYQRWNSIKDFYLRHKPIRIGYEGYAAKVDFDVFNEQKRAEGYWDIQILNMTKGLTDGMGGTLSGRASKEDRIRRLQGVIEQGRLYFPPTLSYTRKYDGQEVDLTQKLLNELDQFPFGKHDDILDCLSRIFDIGMFEASEPSKTEDVRQSNFWRARDASASQEDY